MKLAPTGLYNRYYTVCAGNKINPMPPRMACIHAIPTESLVCQLSLHIDDSHRNTTDIYDIS